MIRVAVVIPNWNGRKWLGPCLSSLRAQRYRAFETIVVDNGSTDGSVAFLAEAFPEVRVCAEPRNLGFAAGMNLGFNAGGPVDYLAALNNDTVAEPDWLEALVRALDADPGAGSAAALMVSLRDPQVIDTAGDGYGWTGLSFKLGAGLPVGQVPELPYQVFGASAGACLYRRRMLDEIGTFDETYFAYMEDVDLALRARLAGWSCVAVPAARVRHAGAASSGSGPSDFSVRLSTRNILVTILKNAPAPVLLPMVTGALLMQMAAIGASLLTGRPAWLALRRRAWAQGVLAAGRGLPAALAARRRNRPLRRLSTLGFLRMITRARAQRARFARGGA